MTKIIKYIMIGIMIILNMGTVYAAQNNPGLVIGDEIIELEKGQIFQRQGITYIPLREISELFGAQVEWIDDTEEIHLEYNDTTVDIKAQTGKYYTNGKKGVMTMISRDGRVYVPLRLVAEFFDYDLTYLPEVELIRVYIEGNEKTDEVLIEEYKAILKEKEEQQRVIYLTFDDGPNQYTSQLLDLLEEYDVKATFFMLDGNIKNYPHVVERMYEEGHGIGVHGVTHDKNRFYVGDYSPYNELEQNNKTLENLLGITTTISRMPYGSVPHLTNAQLEILKTNGYELWDWTVDSRDWANKNGQTTYNQVINQLEKSEREEDIVLFHDLKYTVDTLEKLLEWMEINNVTSKALTEEMEGLSFKEKNMY